jgi:hypothetical protein
MTKVGDYVCIIEVQVAESMNILRNAGFVPGAKVLIQSCTDTGSVIGADMAGNIFVIRSMT